jgi:hypothetical protein
MSKLDKVVSGLGLVGGVVAAVSLQVQYDDDDQVQRVELFGVVPIWDRQWQSVKRRRARREARRQARERDAP